MTACKPVGLLYDQSHGAGPVAKWPVGLPVQFAIPADDFEATYVMYVVEDNGDRVLVTTPVEGFSPELMPRSTYRKSDLKPVE